MASRVSPMRRVRPARGRFGRIPRAIPRRGRTRAPVRLYLKERSIIVRSAAQRRAVERVAFGDERSQRPRAVGVTPEPVEPGVTPRFVNVEDRSASDDAAAMHAGSALPPSIVVPYIVFPTSVSPAYGSAPSGAPCETIEHVLGARRRQLEDRSCVGECAAGRGRAEEVSACSRETGVRLRAVGIAFEAIHDPLARA